MILLHLFLWICSLIKYFMYHNLSVKLYLFVMKTTVISLERQNEKELSKKKKKSKQKVLNYMWVKCVKVGSEMS